MRTPAISLGDFRQRSEAVADQSQAGIAEESRRFLMQLMQLDDTISGLTDERSLRYHAVNETRAVLDFTQGFFFARRTKNGPMRLVAASDLSRTDAEAPAVRWLEDSVARLGRQGRYDRDCPIAATLPDKQRGWHLACYWALPDFADEKARDTAEYPYLHFCWLPLIDGNNIAGGMLLCRTSAWQDNEVNQASRVSRFYARQLQALKGRGKLLRHIGPGSTLKWLALVALVGLCCVPVPMTALAPVTVVARSPFIVTAPVAGVVAEILVEPDATVNEGDALVKFDDLELRNQLEITSRQVEVARSRFSRVSQSAIADPAAKVGLLSAQAELKLAEAERDLAEQRLKRTTLYAAKGGITVYGAKHEWIGRPVQTGEAILLIANPQAVEYEIELAVKDSALLGVGRDVRMYLDSDPLSARKSSIVTSSYSVSVGEQGQSAYRLRARDSSNDGEEPASKSAARIGVRGTAQVYGEKVSLIYFVLRRPITAFRQWTGI